MRIERNDALQVGIQAGLGHLALGVLGCLHDLGKVGDRADADNAVIMARETEVKIIEEIERPHPDLPLADGDLLPMHTVPPGTTSYYWNYVEKRGLAMFASHCGGEIPWTSLGRTEQTGKIEVVYGGYKWCLADGRKASLAGVQLVPMLRDASARGHTERWDQTLAWGTEALGLVGLFNHPNITITAAPLGLVGDTEWNTKTPAEILADIALCINAIPEATNEQRQATRVLWSPRVARYVRQTRLGPGDGKDTIWSLIMETFPGVEFREVRYLDETNPRSQGQLPLGDAMFAYIHNDPRIVAKVRSTLFFSTLSPQNVDFEVRIPAESEIGGIMLTEPLTVSRVDGIFNG